MKMDANTARVFRTLESAIAREQREQAGILCTLCSDAGKIDRGNGTTKPCTCTTGQAEAARRRAKRRKA
jgi:hypothetical protein